MTKSRRVLTGFLFHFPLFSPTGFLVRAGALAALYGLFHLLGWRAQTSLICGVSPTGEELDVLSALPGMLYIIFHFVFVLVVPVLVLGAGFLWGLQRLAGRVSRRGADGA